MFLPLFLLLLVPAGVLVAQDAAPRRVRVQTLALGESPWLQEAWEPQLSVGVFRADGTSVLPVELEYGLANAWQLTAQASVTPGGRVARHGLSLQRGWGVREDGRSLVFAGLEGERGGDEPLEGEGFVAVSVSPRRWHGALLMGRIGAAYGGDGDEVTTSERSSPFRWHTALVVPWSRRVALSAELASADTPGTAVAGAGLWIDAFDWLQVALTSPQLNGRSARRAVALQLVLEIP